MKNQVERQLVNLGLQCRGKVDHLFTDDLRLTSVGAIIRISPNIGLDKLKTELILQKVVEKISEGKNIRENDFLGELPENSLEIVLCQRSTSGKDVHSGQLCFPGGHVDPGETELQAVIREIKEEINLDVGDKTKFVCFGKLIDGYNLQYIKNKRSTAALFVFFQISLENIQLVPNASEISQVNWVKLDYFWKYDINRLRYIWLDWPDCFILLKTFKTLTTEISTEQYNKVKPKLFFWTIDLDQFSIPLWGITGVFTSTIIEAMLFGSNKIELDEEEKLKAKYFIRSTRRLRFDSNSQWMHSVLDYYILEILPPCDLGLLREKL